MDISDYESPLERAKRLTRDQVRAGLLEPWVLDRQNGEAMRDRRNAAEDRMRTAELRRSAFRIVGTGDAKESGQS